MNFPSGHSAEERNTADVYVELMEAFTTAAAADIIVVAPSRSQFCLTDLSCNHAKQQTTIDSDYIILFADTRTQTDD